MTRSFCKVLFVFLTAVLVLAAADPIFGTWKLNAAKSKFSPGPAPKSITATYTQDGDWIVAKNETMDASGQTTTRSNRYKRDGNEYPYEGVNGKGTISIKKIDDYHTEATIKGTGGTTSTRSSISKDGKTRTMRITGVDSKGQKVNNVVVYDRQ